MIRLSELSAARSTELELRYNGPIPREMIEWAWAQDRADEARARNRPCANPLDGKTSQTAARTQ